MSRKKGRILLVLAKEPAPGKAKTRLAATIGSDRAHSLAVAFLEDTLAHAAEAAGLSGARLRVVHAPATAREAFEALAARLGIACELRAQVEVPSLGARLEAAFRDAFLEADEVVAIGTDSPDLASHDYARAFEALERAPAVLGPARDGGYWLVGLAAGPEERARAFLDPIEWSSPRALADTRAAFERHGLASLVLAEHDDVDDAPALAALEARLCLDPGRAPRTARCLGIESGADRGCKL